MNKFFDTAIGKSLVTLLWILGSFTLTYVAAFISGYHWTASWMAIAAVPLVNWLVYTAKLFADKEVPNTVNSVRMVAVPVANAQATAASLLDPTPATPVFAPSAPPADTTAPSSQ